MSVTEFQRHQIFQWFEEALGPERAAIMMDLLPPVGWGDIATKTDLAVLEGRLHGEIAELRGELRGGLAELRGELKAGQGELRAEMADLRGEVKAGQADLLRTLFFAMVASNATLVGLVFAAVKLA